MSVSSLFSTFKYRQFTIKFQYSLLVLDFSSFFPSFAMLPCKYFTAKKSLSDNNDIIFIIGLKFKAITILLILINSFAHDKYAYLASSCPSTSSLILLYINSSISSIVFL